MKKLHKKVALVTGASKGIGAAIAKQLAQDGATVIVNYASSREDADRVVEQILQTGAKAYAVQADVSNSADLKALFKTIVHEHGHLDILVNNAGVSTTQRLQDVTPDDYDYIFETNVKGAFFVAQEVGKRMLARSRGAAPGSFTGGRIINIASMAGLKVLPQIGAYCMSKAAVVHMTRAMAMEWGRFGINTNAICPGYIDTEINHHHWSTEQGQKLIAMLPRKRVGDPKDLDAVLMMLASDQSHFVNGAVIAADDGFAV